KIRDRLMEALNVIDKKKVKDATISRLMSKYIGNSVVKQRILTALKSFDQASVYTIHSFCRQILADNAFESGVLFRSEVAKDNNFIKLGAADHWRKILYHSPESIVSYVMNRSDVDELVELYNKRPLSADLKIKPELSDITPESIDRLYNLICAYYIELTKEWPVERDNVKEIIFRENYLNGNKYRKDSKEALFEEMDQYAGSAAPLIIFDKFENFTADKINSSLNQGNEYIENGIFNICQKIYSTYLEYMEFGSLFLAEMRRSFLDTMDELALNEKSVNIEKSFDDLIKEAHRGLMGASGKFLEEKVRARYKAALIDEFQDTDDLQFEIFNRLFNNRSTILFLIGDPKQAIYRFRGADIFSYLKASELMNNRYTLTHNWRSRTELIQSINDIFSGSDNPFIYDKIKFYLSVPAAQDQAERFMMHGKPIPAFNIWLEPEREDNDRDNTLIERLSAEISCIISIDDDTFSIEKRGVDPKDIAILVRTRRQGLAVKEALLKYNIPSVSRGMGNVFSSEDATPLYFIISAIADPFNLNFVKAALSTPIMGSSANMIYDFNQDISVNFYRYRDIWQSEGVLSMISAFLKEEAVSSRLFAMNGGDRMMTNINHIAEILHEKEYKGRLHPKELAVWFGNIISNPPDDDEYTMRLERDDDAVNIITMHACKGLEFPIVYCPFLGRTSYRGEHYIIYHDPESDNKPVMHLDSNIDENIKKIKEAEDLAEDIRLLYVALTRGKSACRIMLTFNNNFDKSAIYHLLFKRKEDDLKKENDNKSDDEKNNKKKGDKIKFNRNDIVEVLQGIADNSEGRIGFDNGSSMNGKQYISEKFSLEEIAAREFTGKVKGSLSNLSYSSIAKRLMLHANPDEKDFFSEYHTENRKDDEKSFPAGASMGSCIHEIFETIDFTVKDKDYVAARCREILLKYRFDQSW
ncbi:MAG: UvrD-helicase domain-containing protein, partial [Leptospirales bacterium]|nr:UvrD-helicase domain-containing protein [Leptospirales bacterium]